MYCARSKADGSGQFFWLMLPCICWTEWREATRWAFREAVKAGFFVAEFCRSIRGQQGPGALQRGTVSEFVTP
jgi:hypothetical protein